MKKIIIIPAVILFSSLLCFTCNAQDAALPSSNQSQVLTTAEQMPEFVGGEKAMSAFIKSNIRYPDAAKKNGIHGKTYVTFVIDASGKIRDAKVLRGIGAGCDEEAMRVVSLMPAWTPGKQDGKTVSVQFVLPVNFTL